eukprot:Opistho-2@85009
MGWDSHHGPFSVARKHVLCDKHRHFLTCDGMDTPDSSVHSRHCVITSSRYPIHFRCTQHFIDKGIQLLSALRRDEAALHNGMLRGHGEERHTTNCVGACCKYLDGCLRLAHCTADGELKGSPKRLANPVTLHCLDILRPGKAVEVIQQRLGKLCDFEKPLIQKATLNNRSRPPRSPFTINLLVGQHSVVDRIPVDRRLLLVGEAFPVHAQKEPLRPLVIRWIASRYLPVPIKRQAERIELCAHVANVLDCPFFGGNSPFDGRILRWKTKCIPSHRVEHLVPAHAVYPRRAVADRIHADVAHVQTTRRIRKHGQRIKLGH